MSHEPEGHTRTDQGSYTELAPEWAETSWFRFPRDFIRDQRLSWESRAVAAWMASHDPSFRFDVAYVVKAGPSGRDKVRRIMNELETAGYLVRRRTRNGDGSFGPIIYCLHPEPQSTIRSSKPAPENPSLGAKGKTRNRRSEPAPDFPSPGQPSPGAQEGYKETDLQEKKTPLPHEINSTTLAVDLGATEEEMNLLMEKVRRDHPHVKVPSAWLRRCHENGDLPAMLAEVRTAAAAPQAVSVLKPCGECQARDGDPVSARLVWLDEDRRRFNWCPRCHPLGQHTKESA